MVRASRIVTSVGFAFTQNGWAQSYDWGYVKAVDPLPRCLKRPAPMNVVWSSFAPSLTGPVLQALGVKVTAKAFTSLTF